MNWNTLLTKIEADVKQIKEKIYPDMTWKPDSIPARKEWNTLINLISTMQKDCEWLEEYKNPVKKERKFNFVQLSPELADFMKLKQKSFTCYPDRYIMMFIIHYLFANECLNKNKIMESKLPDEFKLLFPLRDNETVFCIQSHLKNLIPNENGKRIIVTPQPEELKLLEKEIESLKKLKELKKNREEFMKFWNDFYTFKN